MTCLYSESTDECTSPPLCLLSTKPSTSPNVSVICVSTNTWQYVQNSDINSSNVEIDSDTLSANTTIITVPGNLFVSNSARLSLINSTIDIQGSFTLNGTLTIDGNSEINVQSCVNLSGSLEISQSVISDFIKNANSTTVANVTIINSKQHCIWGNFKNILYNSTAGNCQQVVATTDVLSSSVIITFQLEPTSSQCGDTTPNVWLTWWIILIIVLVVIAILVAILIAAFSCCQPVCFPHRKSVQDWLVEQQEKIRHSVLSSSV